MIAEKIHEQWVARSTDRNLVTIRPGVIFGPGEGGNVTRLIQGVIGRYFFYLGNKKTNKAGGYVKDLCRAIDWGLNNVNESKKNSILFNYTYDPPPTIEDYVKAICQVAEIDRWTPTIPKEVPITASYVIEGLSKIFRFNHPFKPARVKKSLRSNNIDPKYLRESDYEFHYNLKTALKDWKQENPKDWQ